jgi:hypothetical protein
MNGDPAGLRGAKWRCRVRKPAQIAAFAVESRDARVASRRSRAVPSRQALLHRLSHARKWGLARRSIGDGERRPSRPVSRPWGPRRSRPGSGGGRLALLAAGERVNSRPKAPTASHETRGERTGLSGCLSRVFLSSLICPTELLPELTIYRRGFPIDPKPCGPRERLALAPRSNHAAPLSIELDDLVLSGSDVKGSHPRPRRDELERRLRPRESDLAQSSTLRVEDLDAAVARPPRTFRDGPTGFPPAPEIRRARSPSCRSLRAFRETRRGGRCGCFRCRSPTRSRRARSQPRAAHRVPGRTASIRRKW